MSYVINGCFKGKAFMSSNKKQGFSGMSVMFARLVLCILLVLNAFVFIYYGVINRSNVLEDESLQYIEKWTVVDADGNEFTTGRSYVADKQYEKGFTIYATLPTDVMDNEYLLFVTRKDVAVYINGELRSDFVESRDVNIPGGSIKRFYMMVPLKTSDAGAEVKMVRTVASKDAQLVPETLICTRYGAFDYLVHTYGLSSILALIVLIFSVVVIIVSIVLKIWYKMKIDMLYGALGTFVISSWIISDSFLFPFIFKVYHVDGALNYMMCLLIPIAPALYLNSIQHRRYKSMSAILVVASINALIWPILHFTGIYSFYNIVPVVNTIFGLIAITAIVILVMDAVKGNIRDYKYTFIGFLGFLICCLSQLAVLVVSTITNDSVPMVVGLALLLVFVVVQQVNDLRKIAMEKQHAIDISEAKTRFLASMSHEIRTPINSILGMNEMVLRENRDSVVAQYSKNIKSSGKMLLMLVNDVLDFSKIEAGKLEIHEEHFYMSDMLYDVISLVKERADEKSLELRTELVGEIPNEMLSDEFRIRQILVNIINNAVKYTDNGSITLKLGGKYMENDDYELSISVRDTGKGIRKEDQPYLFEAFSRVDTKSNANIEGTGLGLAIVKSIVDSMKGTIEVQSEYGVGSEFIVTLPMKYLGKETLKSDFMENRVEYDPEPESGTFTALDANILAVDDNKSNLTIVKLFLKRTGIIPDLCSSGSRAIEMCKEKKYDLILLDHMMPQPDGIETLHVIRSDDDSLNKDTKVVVLTANAVAGSRQMYMNEGFDDYLTKPLDSKLLEQTVMKMLPEDKVTVKDKSGPDELSGSADDASSEEMSPIKKKLTSIEGLNYNAALSYCGDDEDLLEEIVGDVAADCGQRAERMRMNLAKKDLDAYRIDAHTIKSTMATLGLKELSERAKKHEYACKENNTGFVFGDAEDFIKEYEEICKKLEG